MDSDISLPAISLCQSLSVVRVYPRVSTRDSGAIQTWRSQAEVVQQLHRGPVQVRLRLALGPAPPPVRTLDPARAPDLVPAPVLLLPLAPPVLAAEAPLPREKVLLKDLSGVAPHHYNLRKLLHPQGKCLLFPSLVFFMLTSLAGM